MIIMIPALAGIMIPSAIHYRAIQKTQLQRMKVIK